MEKRKIFEKKFAGQSSASNVQGRTNGFYFNRRIGSRL